MSSTTAFLVCLGLTMGFALVLMLVLRRPLDVLLVELCGNAGRARFWSSLWAIAIVLAGIYGMLRAIPLDAGHWQDAPGLPFILIGFRTGLTYVLAALGALAGVLLIAIRRFEQGFRPAPPA
jgi:uncharacterized membrane protein YhaH (DUF805 family)